MPDELFSDSMLQAEARRHLDELAGIVEPPFQLAIQAVTGRLDALEDAVRKMRTAQRAFGESKAAAEQCRALESRVDGLIGGTP